MALLYPLFTGYLQLKSFMKTKRIVINIDGEGRNTQQGKNKFKKDNFVYSM